MPRFTAHMLLLAAALASGGPHARAADAPRAADLVARLLPAVVSITSLRRPSAVANMTVAGAPPSGGLAERSAGSDIPRGTRVFGSGFVIDPSGIIATNRHVIEGTTDILVTLQDNTLLHATLVATASQTDVALLRI